MTATTTPEAAFATRSGSFAALRRVRPVHLVAAETALAAVLMSYTLGRQSLWGDEALTADIARHGWDSTLRIVALDEPMTGLYLAIMRIWSLAGTSEVVLRSPSLLAGVAVVPVVYWLTARLFNTRTALVAGLLTAVNTTVVAVAEQARPYAIVLLLVALATLCFVRAVEARTTQSWLLYAVVGAVAVYAHFLVVLILAAHVASLVFLRRSMIPWRAVLTAMGCFTILVVPLVAALARQGSKGLDWIPNPTPTTVRRTFEAFAGGRWFLLLACVAASAVTLGVAIRTWARAGRGMEVWRYGLLLSWLSVPVIGLVVASLARPLFVSRYLIGVLPALLILTAVGITTLRPRWVGAVFLVTLVVLNLAVLRTWMRSDADTTAVNTTVVRQDWRAAVDFVLTRSKPTDTVITQPAWLWPAWNYYAERHASRVRSPRRLREADFVTARDVRSISPSSRHVWVLTTADVESEPRRAISERLAERYDLATTAPFTGAIDVLRYDARD